MVEIIQVNISCSWIKSIIIGQWIKYFEKKEEHSILLSSAFIHYARSFQMHSQRLILWKQSTLKFIDVFHREPLLNCSLECSYSVFIFTHRPWEGNKTLFSLLGRGWGTIMCMSRIHGERHTFSPSIYFVLNLSVSRWWVYRKGKEF